MTGFIIESLYSTGWRRNGDLYWRYQDALKEANRRLKDECARAIRILPVRVGTSPVCEISTHQDSHHD
jgi:hypothetical protein